MRPITKYTQGELMKNCIFLKEIDSITLQFKGINKIKFVKFWIRLIFLC
jgi:hypothetical protein